MRGILNTSAVKLCAVHLFACCAFSVRRVGRFSSHFFTASLLALSQLPTLDSWAATDVTIQNCGPERQRQILNGVEDVRVVITHLQRALNSRLQTHAYDHRTTRKLINAQQILECIQEQMSELDFLCLNKESKSMRDVAEIRRGRTIRFYDLAFSWQGYFTPVITHEISHLCGTNDRHYFHHSGQNPNMAAHKRWDKIASLYQWWVAKGFCVPGDDC